MKKHNWSKFLAAVAATFAAVAATAAPVGVTVNGIPLDDGGSSGAGWVYYPASANLLLQGSGAFTLAGENTNGAVHVVIPMGVANAVTLSNLTLRVTGSDKCVFAQEMNTCVSLFLAGENVLASATNRAGIEVKTGSSLSITNAPGDDAAGLKVWGGESGAGIGGSANASGGTVTINGGIVKAYGGRNGAGIGGGRNGAGCTVTINGGLVVVEGGDRAAGIGGGQHGAGGAVTVNGGEVSANGGSYYGAGIGGGENSAGGVVTVNGGKVSANGGSRSAGIGGGGSYNVYGGTGGTVTISGGQVSAMGDSYGAGIGGGGSYNAYGGTGGTVTISGGQVLANGGSRSAGIGGGGSENFPGGTSGTVTISGGTVFAQSGAGGTDIGPGRNGMVSGSNIFTGGTIFLNGSSIAPTPSNDTARVACAVVTGFAPNESVTFGSPVSGLPTYYGTTDIYADSYGCMYLWLPDGDYSFLANERVCAAKVLNGVGSTGVTVNGDEVAFGPADPAVGWTYTPSNSMLKLSGVEPFTLSGINVIGGVCVVAQSGLLQVAAVTFSNLTLRAVGDGQCAFALTGRPSSVSLSLAGTNTLVSGFGRAGLEVTARQALSVTNVPCDEAASLVTVGGTYGAGIGGSHEDSGGTIKISGGQVSARGGSNGAGIGGGSLGAGGTVTVFGGQVSAKSDRYGAGIGGGYCGAGGAVEILGGQVSATGGSYGAGIGGGSFGTGGTATISGGEVAAIGGGGGAGIGGGEDGAGGMTTIVGGFVTAVGRDYGAGIGGGSGGASGTNIITGGTVIAQGAGKGAAIGPGLHGAASGCNLFTGGTIRPANSLVSPTPSNSTARVACAVVTGFEPDAPVVFGSTSNLPDYYGTSDIFADDTGSIYLWLPDGDYTFTANGRDCTAKVLNGVGSTGVTVNGDEVAFGPTNPAAVWTYDATTRSLKLPGAGPFTLSGANAAGGVCVAVQGNYFQMMAITFSNLTLRTTGGDQCVFALGQLSRVSLCLAGANALVSGENRAGLEVPAGRTLSITNAPGDDAAALTATGGFYGAGIGGGHNDDGGAVTVSGGVVTAKGGFDGAGIGGGDGGAGGTVTIKGGMVIANGGLSSAGIGGGRSGAGGTVTVSGGTVFAQSGAGGTDIGSGYNGAISGANLFAGGSIRPANDMIAPAPSNGTARVWCVTVPGFAPGATVVITSLGPYGVNDLFADDDGKLYLWLPDGGYAFMVDGTGYTVTVAGAATTAAAGFNVPAFATDGSALVFDGALLTIKIINAQNGVMYTLYATDTLGGLWTLEQVVQAQADGDLVFENISASPAKRFFKVAAGTCSPQ